MLWTIVRLSKKKSFNYDCRLMPTVLPMMNSRNIRVNRHNYDSDSLRLTEKVLLVEEESDIVTRR